MQTFLMVVSSLTGLTNQQEFASFNVIKGVELREKSELVSYRLISGNTWRSFHELNKMLLDSSAIVELYKRLQDVYVMLS